MPSIKDKLASALGRKDEEPNIALAKEIAAQNNRESIKALMQVIHGKGSGLQNDAIKVLYEVGALAPQLLEPHTHFFADLITHKNNRLQWGAMTALASIAAYTPGQVHPFLPAIRQAAQSGSVITCDQAVKIFVAMARQPAYLAEAMQAMLTLLEAAPHNQFAMYAELAHAAATSPYLPELKGIIEIRMPQLPKPTQQARLLKLLKKIDKIK